jgi:hypothetical protein
MTYFRTLALGLAFSVAALPAMAQMSGGGLGGGMGGAGGAPQTQPQARTPDIAPPALPGAGGIPVATGPVVQKPITGDPTTALFAAIVKGDDTAAQNALGHGADLNGQNQFGETPLDLSIALNRTSITFLLLQTRNELAAQGGGNEPIGAPWMLNAPNAPNSTKQKAAYQPPAPPTPHAAPATGTGTPNAEAGFLGFGPSK